MSSRVSGRRRSELTRLPRALTDGGHPPTPRPGILRSRRPWMRRDGRPRGTAAGRAVADTAPSSPGREALHPPRRGWAGPRICATGASAWRLPSRRTPTRARVCSCRRSKAPSSRKPPASRPTTRGSGKGGSPTGWPSRRSPRTGSGPCGPCGCTAGARCTPPGRGNGPGFFTPRSPSAQRETRAGLFPGEPGPQDSHRNPAAGSQRPASPRSWRAWRENGNVPDDRIENPPARAGGAAGAPPLGLPSQQSALRSRHGRPGAP